MITPVRIQRKRTKGWNMQAASPNGLPVVYVGRPSKWGNPFKVGKVYLDYVNVALTGPLTNLAAVQSYANWVEVMPGKVDQIKAELRGKNLACWCPLDQPCHADVLLELAFWQ